MSFGEVAWSNFTVVPDTQITVTVPVGAGPGRLESDQDQQGLGEISTDFRFIPAPAFNLLDPFNPTAGSPGNGFRINGQNLDVGGLEPGRLRVFIEKLSSNCDIYYISEYLQYSSDCGGSWPPWRIY